MRYAIGALPLLLWAGALWAWPVQQLLAPCTASPDTALYTSVPLHPETPPQGTGLGPRFPVTNVGPVRLHIPGRGDKPLKWPVGSGEGCPLAELEPGMLPTASMAVIEDVGAVYVLCQTQSVCYCPQKNPAR